jgi:Protein of unknown function (DUF998)
MTSQDLTRSAATTGTPLATGAIFCVVYQAVALVALHLLRPDLAPASNFISDYAVGPFGWIMTTWFIAGACYMVLLAVGLARSGLKSAPVRIAMFLMIVAAAGLLTSAIFPVDPPGAPSTRTGDIHDYSFLANVISIVLMAVLLPLGLGGHPGWRTFRPLAWVLTGLFALAFAIQFATLHKGMPYGLANRFFVAVFFAWALATAMRLRRVLLNR